MIELKGLWKSFEDRDVLKDINATFENGKRLIQSAFVFLKIGIKS